MNKKIDFNRKILNSHRASMTTRFFGSNYNELRKWSGNNEICSFTKLFYITQGEFILKINGQQINPKQGDLVLIPAGISHSYYQTAPDYSTNLFFVDLQILFNNNEFAEIIDAPFISTVGCSLEIIEIYKELIKTRDSVDLYSSSILQSNLITRLLLIFFENCDKSNLKFKQPQNNSIHSAIEFINEHFSEKITIDELAKKAHLSTNHFSASFKKITGVSPQQYIHLLKIRKAELLLEKTNMTVPEIASELNYYDTAQFCKLFKKNSGFSPTEYRRLSVQAVLLIENNQTIPHDFVKPSKSLDEIINGNH